MENPLSLKGKTTRQTPNNFTMIKSITIIFVYVSRLKKIYFIFLCFHTHTLIISFKGGKLLLSPFYFFSPRTFLLAVFFFFKRLPLGCFLFFFFLVRLPLSLLLHILSLCLPKGGSTLLSPSSSCLVLKSCKSVKETSKDGKFIKAGQILDKYLDKCIYRGLNR